MATRRRGAARPLAAALRKVTAKTFKRRGFAAAAILTEWPIIVGEDLAACTAPERLRRDGTLRLRVEGPIALELQHREPEILERIATYYGYRAVRRLTFVRGTLEKAAPRLPRRRPEIDSTGARSVDHAVRQIRDDGLKRALGGLGRAVRAPAPDE